jgi:type I restriction enzyme S subunit
MVKQYKKYKESGIEWIGEIPYDWKTIKLKRLTPIKRGASPRPIDDLKYFDDNGEFAWVRIADVSASERYLETTTEKLSELGASLSVKRFPGDFFLSIAGSVGKPIITKIKCCIHDGFVWFPELKINPEILYYIFQTGLPFIGLGKFGTQLNLNTETIGNIVIPNLSNIEINNIVVYLDYKISIIEELISKKQKLIELLKEKRQAIITEGVTKGLNPKAKMRESGVKWLGEIPVDWKLTPFRFIAVKIGSGVTPKGGAEVYKEEGVTFIRSQNVHFDGLRLDDVAKIDLETHRKMSNSKVQFKDVLLNITGASIGRCCVVNIDEEMNVNQHVCIIRPKSNKVVSEYLNLVLQSDIGQTQVRMELTGGNRDGLTFEALKAFVLPLPDLKVQNEIINQVGIQINQLFGLEAKIISQIEKLKEFRQSIISEAVTGKIDVREWQPNTNNN